MPTGYGFYIADTLKETVFKSNQQTTTPLLNHQLQMSTR